MGNLHALPSASTLKGALRIYRGYWFMAGPAFALALQFYLNHRLGLAEMFPRATFPDVLCGVSCVVLLVYIAASCLTHRSLSRFLPEASNVAGVASFACLAVSAPLGFSGHLFVFLVAGSVLFAFYFMSQIILWFEVFCCLDNVVNLLFGLLFTALSGVLCWFLLGLFGARLLVAEVAYVLLGGVCMGFARRKIPELDSRRPASRSFANLPASLLAATFLVGFGLMYSTCSISLHDLHASFSWSLTIFSAVLCAIVFLGSSRISIQMLYYVAAPLTMAGIAISLFSPLAASFSLTLVNLGCYTFFVFVAILHCSICHKQNLNPLRATSLLVLSLYIGIFGGRALFSVVDGFVDPAFVDAAHAVVSAVLVMILVVCLMAGNVAARKEIIEREVKQGFDHINEYDTNEFAERIVSSYKLTDREFEVLKLLLKGKTATAIAQDLVVAPGTAKAHISKIYRKLDIHTKDELLDMIPSERAR